MPSMSQFKIVDGEVVMVECQTKTLRPPVLPSGFALAEPLPRPADYGEHWYPLDDGTGIRRGSSYGAPVWILKKVPVLKMRARPGDDVLLRPTDAALRAGFTMPLAVTDEFRQPLPGEAHVSRRYRHGHRYANVFLCETFNESRERADGRWIVATAERGEAPASDPVAKTLTPQQVKTIQSRLIACGLNQTSILRILG